MWQTFNMINDVTISFILAIISHLFGQTLQYPHSILKMKRRNKNVLPLLQPD